MKKKRTKVDTLETLTDQEIEVITKHASSRRNVRLVSSKQVNMRLSAETLAKAKKIAASQGKPVTTFLSSLLQEGIDRLWKIYSKVD